MGLLVEPTVIVEPNRSDADAALAGSEEHRAKSAGRTHVSKRLPIIPTGPNY